MKRRNVLFVVTVFGVIGLGIWTEASRREDPTDKVVLAAPPNPAFEELVPPTGEEYVFGRVLDVVGAPVEDAEVLLSSSRAETTEAAPLFWAMTDDEGEFSLDDVRPGTYTATVVRPDRRPEQFQVDVPTEGALVLRLALEAPGPVDPLPDFDRVDVTGRVLVPSTHPRAGTLSTQGYEVWVVPEEEDPLELTGVMKRRVTVDETGGFALPGLVAGRYELRLLPPWARGGSWPVLATADLVATPDAGDAPRLVLRSAEISGALRDLASRPIQGALVELWPRDVPHRRWPLATTDARGEFRLTDLPPGTYVVELRAGGARLERTVQVGAEARERLQLEPVDPRR